MTRLTYTIASVLTREQREKLVRLGRIRKTPNPNRASGRGTQKFPECYRDVKR